MTDRPVPKAVLDTNIFVAAGFNRQSSCARILDLVREGNVKLIWSEATRNETEFVLEKIPPLSWREVEHLFHPSGWQPDPPFTDEFDYVEDEDDRKFAALAKACGAVLVSSDDHLLRHRLRTDIAIVSPGEFLHSIAGIAETKPPGIYG